MKNTDLESYLNSLLAVSLFKDYAPNGLQVEGKREIKKIITGVTASQALVDEAIRLQADALLVHHGYFWPGEPQAIRGMKGQRIRSLIRNEIPNSSPKCDTLQFKRLASFLQKPWLAA